MSNPFYNNTAPLVPGTLAQAEDLNDQFDAVEVGCDGIKTAIDLKATIAGQAYTGAHDFTAGTVVVAAPTLAAHPTTKLYADNLAFMAGTFPDQTGNAGKLITTDGTTASWQDLDAGTF